ncbi:MAG TPA: ABC transporter permease [Mycobacteriales bacterium]|nr:ABC transporter permease [Mycobacteriales bacterium]
MTAAAPTADAGRGPGWALSDIGVMTWRNLLRVARSPELIFFGAVQPIIFVVLFAYVFGNSITLPGFPFSYRQFLMAGIFVQTIVFGSVASTGIGIADDLAKGMVDRFRSLPMTRSSLLVGRTLSDVVRNAFTTVILLAVGFAIGFRFHGGVAAGLAGIGLALLFGFAFSWIAACIGLLVRSVEAAQTGGFVWLFPLTFASSAFVSTGNMPGWLRAFADINPVTVTVNSLRALFDGTPIGDNVWQALAWIAGVLLVFVPLAVSLYRRTTTR